MRSYGLSCQPAWGACSSMPAMGARSGTSKYSNYIREPGLDLPEECPGCGAPPTEYKCEYCGTVFSPVVETAG